MMIDFALEAERKEGMSPEESIYQACLLALSADHDDDGGGVAGRFAARARTRDRQRIAPADGNLDRRRSLAFAISHALHHAGDLSLSRPSRCAGWKNAGIAVEFGQAELPLRTSPEPEPEPSRGVCLGERRK